MRKLWRVVWLCYTVTFCASMFAFAAGLIHLPKPVALSLIAAMLIGACVQWRIGSMACPVRR